MQRGELVSVCARLYKFWQYPSSICSAWGAPGRPQRCAAVPKAPLRRLCDVPMADNMLQAGEKVAEEVGSACHATFRLRHIPLTLCCLSSAAAAEDTLGSGEGRGLKRKKTVTWADGDFPLPLELDAAEPLSPPAAAAAAAAPQNLAAAPPLRTATAGGCEDAAGGKREAEEDPAVVVLPCDGLFDSLTSDLLQQQGE